MRNFYSIMASVTLVTCLGIAANGYARTAPQSLASPLKVERSLKMAETKMETVTNAPKKIKSQNFEKLNANKVPTRAEGTAPSSIVGNSYIVVYDDGYYGACNLSTTVKAGSGNTVILEGLLEGFDVSGTYDATTGIITIPGGVLVGRDLTYGNVTLYAASGNSYSPSDPITVTVTEQGLSFDSGMIGGVAYNGGVAPLAQVDAPEGFISNGNITYTTSGKTPRTVDFPLYIKKINESTIEFLGISPALLSGLLDSDTNYAPTYKTEYVLDSDAKTATGEVQEVTQVSGVGDIYFGMDVSGIIENPIFNVSVSNNTSTLTLQQPGVLVYFVNEDLYGGNINDLTITVDMDIFTATPEGGDQEEDNVWEDAGTVTFVDGWVLPAFEINQLDEKNWFEVPIQKNTENANLYRLVDPYHQASCPVLQYNTSKTVGYIVFDATDPDHVVVNLEQIEAGFANSSYGISKFYCYNMLAMYSNYFGMSPSNFVDYYGNVIPYTTFKEGVFSLGHLETTNGIVYDANFGIQGDVEGGYSWTGENDEPADMTAYVVFEGAKVPSSAVETIGSDIQNSEVIYFDLLGRRVNNPVGLVIRKQGETVSKVLVK